MSIFSIEEKARIEFEDYKKFKYNIWSKLSEEEKRVIEEDRKFHPEEEMTLEKYEKQFRKAHNIVDELRNSKYFQNKGNVDIYDLVIDKMRNPEHNYHPDGFNDSKIINLRSNLDLLGFLDRILGRYIFREENGTSGRRLEPNDERQYSGYKALKTVQHHF